MLIKLLKISVFFIVFLTNQIAPNSVIGKKVNVECFDVFNIPYEEEIKFYATKYNLPMELVIGICSVESNFSNNAISHKGAIGIMQLHPSLYRKLLNSDEVITDIKTNLNIGCWYIRKLLDKFNTNYIKVIKCYYTGEPLFSYLEYNPAVIEYSLKVAERIRYFRDKKIMKCRYIIKDI